MIAPDRRALALLCLLAALLLSCAGGVAAAGAPPELTVSIRAGSITVAGAQTSGAVEIATSAARGLKEPSTVLVRLGPGVDAAEFESYLASNETDEPDTISRFGAVVFDAEGRAGATSEAQTVLAPGNYVALNAEGERSSTWSHASFTVTSSTAPALLPAPEAVEKTFDFAFKGPRTLHDGEVVRFENEGFLIHMDEALPVRSSTAAAKLARDLLTGHERAAERLISARPVGFAGPLSSGAFQQQTISAPPGWYVQVCFLATQDGREQTRLGMERVIRIAS